MFVHPHRDLKQTSADVADVVVRSTVCAPAATGAAPITTPAMHAMPTWRVIHAVTHTPEQMRPLPCRAPTLNLLSTFMTHSWLTTPHHRESSAGLTICLCVTDC